MERYKVLEAFIGERRVGTLALYKGRLVAFEYNEGWLREGFSISPFSLPLQKKVFITTPDPITIGTPLDLTLKLPDGEMISVKGIVRWTRDEDKSGSRAGMGIEFLDMKKEDEEKIKHNL